MLNQEGFNFNFFSYFFQCEALPFSSLHLISVYLGFLDFIMISNSKGNVLLNYRNKIISTIARLCSILSSASYQDPFLSYFS